MNSTKQITSGNELLAPNEAQSHNAAHSELDVWLEMFSLFIHDIESPLASMKYLIKLIEENKLDLNTERHRRLVRSTGIALERSESIIFDIMTVARSGRIGLPVSKKELRPLPLISESVEMALAAADERGVNLMLVPAKIVPLVLADEHLLRRALDNLLYNAIRHTPSGGEVRVYTELGEQSFFVHIRDGGPGLGDIDHERLFEKYGQIELRSSRKHRGVGLGLYFCRLAVTGMEGTIIADDHPDGGAVFTIRLRLIKESDNG